MKKICIGFKIVVLLSMLTGLGCPLSAFALGGAVAAEVQGVQISGRVVDTKGEPLIGVNVVIVGTTTGVSTDINGKYVIRGVPVGNSLRFTYMGYVEKLIKVTADMKVLDVVLEEDSKALDEVIVVAYGTQKRESVLSSVSTVNAKNLIKTTASTTSTALVGKMAGVNSRHTEGTPGSSAKIQIRNLGDPLYVIDGVIKDAGEFNNLDMNDIESLSVVKDGAAAIYGVKAANGVVLVKTKRGSGKFTVGVNFYHSWQSWARFPEMGNAYEVTRAQYERKINSGVNVDVEAAKAELEKYKEGYYNPETGEDYRSFDWTSFARKNVPMMYYNVNASGGNEKFNYYVALSHIDQDAVFKDFNFNRSNFQANLEAQITETLKIGMTSNGRIETRDNPGLESDDDYMYMRWGMIANDPRYRPYANDNPKYPAFNDYFNGAMNLGAKTKDYAGYYKDVWRVFEGDWHVEWKTPLPGLTARVMYSYFYATQEREAFQKAYDLYTYDRKTDTYNVAKRYEDSWMQRGANAAEKNSYQATLNYEQTFADKHQVYVGLDYSLNESEGYNYAIAAEGFTNEDIHFLASARQYAKDEGPGGSKSKSRRLGLTANVNYIYDNRYFVDFSYRVDGKSDFGSKKRYAPFWSTGIGWNLHNEKFLKGSFANILRLKASYGQTGTQQGSDGANTLYKYITDNRYMYWTGAELQGLGNPYLTWQKTDEFNFGVEFGLWKGRMKGEFNVYTKKTSNLLSNMDLPHSNGFASYVDNVGEVKNNGWEASASVYVIRNAERDINWIIGGQLTYNKNYVSKLSEAIKAQNEAYLKEDVDVANLFYEGRPQNGIYVVRSLGIDPANGQEIFLDKDGNRTDIWKASDKVYVGQADPRYRGIANTMFMWKGLTVNVSASFYWGGKRYNSTIIDRVEVGRTTLMAQNVDARALYDRWQKPGDIVPFRKYDDSSTRATSRFVMDDKVFEIQSVGLQYKWDSAWVKKYMRATSVTFGVNMSDLWHFSTIKMERGTSYPFARNIQGSIKFLF